MKKSILLLQYFGLIGSLNSIYEKIIVDKYRFRGKAIRNIPTFPLNDINPELLFFQYNKKLSITYLIHFFYPDKAGGTERFIFNLAREQQRRGNEVNVITLGRRSISEYSGMMGGLLYRNYEYEGIHVTEVRYRKAPLGFYYKRVTDEDRVMYSFAIDCIEKHVPDVIHCAYPQPFASFLRASKENNVPYIITATDFNILCHYATMVDKTGNFCSGSEKGQRCRRMCSTYGIRDYGVRYDKAYELLDSAGAVTSPSIFVKSVLEQEFPKQYIRVVPHGIGADFKSVKLHTKTRRFVYAGTLSELKGVHLLIEAFKRIEGDVSLLIYGDGNAVYKNKIKKLASSDYRIKMEMPLPANEMAELFQNSDCVVIPSIWYETYNFVLREALLCGCITVASRIGAMPEAVSEGINGFLFEPGSIDGLKCALERARDFNWGNYQQSSFYTIEEESLKYEQIYNFCLNSEERNTLNDSQKSLSLSGN